MKNLQEKLDKLPSEIVWKDVNYRLFILKRSSNDQWEVAYARGKYFCDKAKCIDTLDAIDENLMIADISDVSLEGAVDKILERIGRIAELAEDMEFCY